MSHLEKPTITILCSSIALGVYVPALLVNYQLKKYKLKTEVVVLENYYTSQSQEKLKQHKQAYHNNFSMALMARRMPKDVQLSLDQELVDSLLTIWEAENRLNFIVSSGFWMPIIEKYRNRVANKQVNVDICRFDAQVSASFKSYKKLHPHDNEIWLWNWEQKRLIYELPVTDKLPIPYYQRANRFVIHGGGWGIGTYESKIPELEERGILLDIVAYYMAETVHIKPGNRYFMVNPQWSPGQKNSNQEHEFPPFGEVTDKTDFKTREEYHELYDFIRQSKGIISKPGGGTLIDSLTSATPMILLEPYGYDEQSNADIWEHLGYGISYNKWKENDYDLSILEKLHKNILTRDIKTMNYAQTYVETLETRLYHS